MLSRISFAVFLFLIFTFTSCCNNRDRSKDPSVKWINIHRLLMNEPHSYTFMIKDNPESNEFKMIQVSNYWPRYGDKASPRIIEDIPEGEPMWASAKIANYYDGQYFYDLEIHIHSPKDIEAGGWEKQVGKSRQKGQNNVIE